MRKYPAGVTIYAEELTCSNGTAIDVTSSNSSANVALGGDVTPGPFLWLRLDSSSWQKAEPGHAAAHLTREQVKKLRDALDEFLREHRHLSLV